jgi:DNA ligase 1
MSASLMHGSDWTGQDVSGWWLSEKLDGFRCYWDGSRFLSRDGLEFEVPAWFRAGMPRQALDGELWAGAATTHNDVQRAVTSGRWESLVFRPFDVPLRGLKIEQAISVLAALALPAHVEPVKYQRLASTPEAISLMRQVVAAGGEGVMLRKAASGYAPCRSEKLLKLKPALVN